MKILIILSCIASIWYIDYQTMEIEKKAQELQNYNTFESITKSELDLEKEKFEKQMKEFDNLIFNK